MEETILERVACGDQAAVAECLKRYGDLVWSLARRLTANTSDAEDAVQEVFIDLWSNASRFDRKLASEVTFVSMIARRRLIDRLRKSKREPGIETLEDRAVDSKMQTTLPVEAMDQAARVSRLIETFKPEQQRVLRMAVYEGFTHSEIAKSLDLPLGTVKTHVRRGLLRIRENLTEVTA